MREKKDLNGNYLLLEAMIDGHKVLICSVYAPNVDTPEFFENLFENIEDMDCENVVICGDFNLVMDPLIDYCNYRQTNNPNARLKLLELIDHFNYIDAFRQFHPNTRRYTWRKRTPFKQARLDFFLISGNLLRSLNNCTINPGYRTDHSSVKINLSFRNFNRGRGFWKFNNSLLYDSTYLDIINKKIDDIKKQYAVPVYLFDNVVNIPDDEIQFVINDQLFLETLLMEIRGKSISYSSYIKKKRLENKLMEEIALLENSEQEQTIDDLISKQKELEDMRKEKLKGAFIRSRAKWVEEGEKPSKYFCHLESRNFTNKLIPKIEEDNGNIISEQHEILEATKKFYENLYSSREHDIEDIDLNAQLNFNDIKKLTEEESEKLEGTISLKEASQTLFKMKSNKSPGSDGFTAEFFKVFWKKLGTFVVR
ncbi:hypothetical protein FSP39_021885 [Pinctada imbricata]|uniref:Endonuclease/exonuclease/phosphatase domain-containing protein n=1 Tax=Pinctada imbricata TaxID=66713 RepID=A0AA89BSG9_PINIB|nr:hypothetical protein FSP39_021885 [Pinctada imbricata]